jgi:hypothetical protein
LAHYHPVPDNWQARRAIISQALSEAKNLFLFL